MANKVVTDLSTHRLVDFENIHQVFSKYGKPNYLKSNKSGGIVHDVVLYKRLINGLKSRIIYNFVNEHIASVSYTIQVVNKADEQLLDVFLKEKQVQQYNLLKQRPQPFPKQLKNLRPINRLRSPSPLLTITRRLFKILMLPCILINIPTPTLNMLTAQNFNSHFNPYGVQLT